MSPASIAMSVPVPMAIPTSACGHIRGIFKGYKELKRAGFKDIELIENVTM